MKLNATKFCLNTELKPKIQTENENENFSVAENVGFSNFCFELPFSSADLSDHSKLSRQFRQLRH